MARRDDAGYGSPTEIAAHVQPNRNQLQHAFTKYGDADVREVHVVVDPLTAARRLDDIVSLWYNHEGWCRRTGIALRFHVPHLGSGELVSLARFAGDMGSLADGSPDDRPWS